MPLRSAISFSIIFLLINTVMPEIKAWLALCRVSNLPTVWMNVLAAAALASGAVGAPFPVFSGLLLLLAMSCFYTGGMAFNDYCDRHWDAQHQPYRPIPAGKVTAKQALFISLLLFALGVLMLTFVPHRHGLIAGIGLLTLIVAYDLFHKQHWLTVVLMAGARLGVYLVTSYALTGSLITSVWMLGLIQCGWTLLVTAVARLEHRFPQGYPFPVIPWMLAAMGLVDGLVLAVLLSPLWLVAGVVTLVLTRWGQKYVRGD